MNPRTALADMRTMRLLFPAAEREAAELGDELPGPEHLLLAALTLPDDSGRTALAACGLFAEDVRAAIPAAHADSLRAMGIPDHADLGISARAAPHGPFRSSGSAQIVFRRAVALAKTVSRTRLRTAHVVWAVAELDSGTAARVLSALQVNRPELLRAAQLAAADGAPSR